MRAMKLQVKREGVDPRRVEQARVRAGLNQKELAELVGCSPRTIQYWEATNGTTRRPHSRYVRLLAQATGKPIAWFYSDNGVEA